MARSEPMSTNKNTKLSNSAIVTLALYLLGGESKYIDAEDIAMKANELAPGRFAWRKYPEQINLRYVEIRLCEARNPQKGALILGSMKKGWILSENGLSFAKDNLKHLHSTNLSRPPMSKKEMTLQHHEKERMLSSKALIKFNANEVESVTVQEAEAFFRVDDYVTGIARKEKLTRIINTFGDDPELGQAVKILAEKVRKI
jgi:hypothetical protein